MKSANPIFTHPAIQLLSKCKTLNTLNQVHGHMITTGLALHTYPLSKILLSSSDLELTYAHTIFDHIQNPTVFLFNTLISSVITNHRSQTHLAFSLYNRIILSGDDKLKPNCFTYPSLFKACRSQPWVRYGSVLHAHVLKFLEPGFDRFVQASLLNFYANCGKLGVARYLFEQINKPDLATWNSLLTAHARNASASDGGIKDADSCLSLEVFRLFNEMQNSLIRPNEITLVVLISACADLGALYQGMWAHAYVIRHRLKLNCYVGTSLINMYLKCGCLGQAYQTFDKLPQRDTSCYNAMIGGFAIHGYGQKAFQIYEKMRIVGILPDNITFNVSMFACSGVGLVDEGCKVFESIKEFYGIEPTLEHYGYLVDLLARAGRLQDAEKRIKEMPMKPNATLWRSLYAGARIHGNVAIEKVALKHLLELEPETSDNYVFFSNMYARVNKWEYVNRVRKAGS
ncbi:hypothetical protein LWI28_028936 [Acer negundo]|uniref:Pentatricopeptide repeat-containing protein n=1 Tax=Acer negundo TaxID=4023 RepID=A0AAD5JNP8_ACENE|nr:hypothetical protein LWI28_028936 [Acer negundo]